MTSKNLKKKKNLRFERLRALTATVNLALVLFNLTYVGWRDFYLRNLTQIQKIYDPIKGIEPHRETQNYLETVEELESLISVRRINSKIAENKLKELRDLSVEMIEIGRASCRERV